MYSKPFKIWAFFLGLLIAAAVLLIPWNADTPPDPQPSIPATDSTTLPNATGSTPTAGTEPTDPPTNPTEPATQPTEPTPTAPAPTEPTQPTAATEPPPEPTEPTLPEHQHSYTAVVTQPTCTEAGYTTHTCDCGDSYVDSEVPAKGHSYTSKITKEATCTQEGVKTFTCKCGKSYTEKIAKLAHSYTAKVTKNATCTEAGVKTFTCSGCGDAYTEEIAALGHSWGPWETVVEATETTEGEAQRECMTCHAVETETHKAGEHKHNYTATVVEPTCKAEGYTLHSCPCGDSYKDTVVPKINHNYQGVKVDATCTEKGGTRYTCTMCSKTFMDDTESALGHAYSKWATVKEPTATENGLQERTCSRCHDKQTQVLYASDNTPETYIDPAVEEMNIPHAKYKAAYQYGALRVSDYCLDWNCYLSIQVLEEEGYDSLLITYYQPDGTQVEYTLKISQDMKDRGYIRYFDIYDDGSYAICYMGNYTSG